MGFEIYFMMSVTNDQVRSSQSYLVLDLPTWIAYIRSHTLGFQ